MARLVRFAAFTIALLFAVGFSTANAGALPGDLIVTDFSAAGGNGAVFIVDPNLGTQTILSSGGLFLDPWDVDVDAGGTPRIFISDIGSDAIIEVDPNTGAQVLVTMAGLLANPTGVEVGVGTDLWVTDSGTNSLVKVDKNTGFQTLVHSGAPFVSPFGVAVNKFGDVYVLDRVKNGGTVFKMVGGVPVSISNGAPFQQPYGLTIDQGAPIFPANEPGGIWVVDRNAAAGPGAIIYVDPNTGAKTIVSQQQFFSEASGVTIGPSTSGSPFYACDYATRVVVRFDPAGLPSTNQTLVSSGGLFSNPVKLAVFPEQPVQTETSTWGRVKGLYR